MNGPAEPPTRTVAVGEVELVAQSFGDPKHAPVLLVAGTSCSMDWWPSALCARLAALRLFVTRFDQRDTGRATHGEPWRPSWSLPDLVTDSVGLLDALDIEAAHWVGFSQGGWVAQLAALDHPRRVLSLTLLSSRPNGHGPVDPDLPEITDRLLTAWDRLAVEPDWGDPEDVVCYLVEGERALAGDEFDEAHAHGIAERCVARAHQVRTAVANHPAAPQGPRWRHRLGDLAVPTLVVHGTADPLFPIGNAEAMAREIPDARLQRLPGIGHELPPRAWDRAVALVEDQVFGC